MSVCRCCIVFLAYAVNADVVYEQIIYFYYKLLL